MTCWRACVTHAALAVLKQHVDSDNLVIGGQSGSARILKTSRRGHDVEAVERAVRVALEAGFRPNVDFLLGLPGKTREDVDATVALIARLSAVGARAHGHTRSCLCRELRFEIRRQVRSMLRARNA